MWTYELYHHGIKGMKWGVRRYQNLDGTLTSAGKKRYVNIDVITSKKTGEKLYMAEQRSKRAYDPEHYFTIISNGKKVGNLIIENQKDNLYINWIDIKKTERGKGYANSVMDYTINYAKKNNYKTMTLEVPGTSPDARHIYKKHGFKEDTSIRPDVNDGWGGLTAMKRKVKK